MSMIYLKVYLYSCSAFLRYADIWLPDDILFDKHFSGSRNVVSIPFLGLPGLHLVTEYRNTLLSKQSTNRTISPTVLPPTLMEGTLVYDNGCTNVFFTTIKVPKSPFLSPDG